MCVLVRKSLCLYINAIPCLRGYLFNLIRVIALSHEDREVCIENVSEFSHTFSVLEDIAVRRSPIYVTIVVSVS